MKIIHTSDLMIDNDYNYSMQLNKVKGLRSENLNSFKNIIEYAKSNAVKVIIIAGNVFTTEFVPYSCLNAFIDLIKNNSNIDFIIPYGNKDEAYLFNNLEEKPNNLYTFSKDFSKKEYTYLDIYGFNYNDLNEKIKPLNINENKINILTFSKELTENNLESFKEYNIDYLALGGKKQHQEGKVIDINYTYSGIPYQNDFETKGKTGFYLIDTLKDSFTYEFIKFDGIKFNNLGLDITGITNYGLIESKLVNGTSKYPKNSLMRITLRGKTPIGFVVNTLELEKKLNEKFYFAKVIDDTVFDSNVSEYEKDVSLKSEFIKEVMKNQEFDDYLKKEIIKLGLSSLSKE